MAILKEPVAAVLDRRKTYQEAEAYYEGQIAESFATAKLRHAFRTTGERGRLNYCRPIVDAVNNRLEINALVGTTTRATDAVNQVWRDNELDLEAQEIHRRALTFGDCYVAVWPGEDGKLQVSYNSPQNMALVYDPENPRKKLYAVKMWKPSEQQTRMNIYTPDKILKYVSDSGEVTEGTQWNAAGSVENPWGEVPVFHFRTHRPFGRPEHLDAYDAQNAINKLFITQMFTVDYQGAPQRYALSNFGNESEVSDFDEDVNDRDNLSALKNGPGELWYLKGVSSVGQFQPAEADSFWLPIQNIVRAMASLTETPLHYFEKNGNLPAGNALRTAEAPLLKKVKDRQASFGATWRELCNFILKVEGVSGDIHVFWKEVESLDELERWDVALKKINAGLSHKQALREGGYSEQDIEKIMAERTAEAAAGLYYTRAPQTRVNNSSDETAAVTPPADTTGGNN